MSTINRADADQYFGAHAKTAEWFGFPEGSREGAIAGARRTLSRGLGRELYEYEAYSEGDQARDDYAVYEQALYDLQRSRVSDPTSGIPYPVAMPSQSETTIPFTSLYSPDALRWLGAVNAVSCVRGS